MKQAVSRYMRYTCCLILVLLVLTACQKKESAGCKPETNEYHFRANAQILISTSPVRDSLYQYAQFTIVPGNNLIFLYTHTRSDCPEIMDDEGLRRIYFEIPDSVNQFSIKDSVELRQANCMVRFDCECYPLIPVFINKGTIEGVKVNNTFWKVKLKLTLPGSTSVLEDEHIYSRK